MANFANSPASYFSRTQQLQQNISDMNKKQIAESPLVQTPSMQKTATPSSVAPQTPASGNPKPKKARSNKRMMQFAALGVLFLVLVGGGVGLFLMGQSQDTRQQASVPDGIGRIFLDPRSTSLAAGAPQELNIKLNMGGEIPVNGIQFVIEVVGDVPADLEFVESTNLQGLTLANTTMTDIPNGKKILTGYLATPPTPFISPAIDFSVGTLNFTAPTSGSIAIRFDPVTSKVIKQEGSEDVLRTPTEEYTYTFGAGGNEASPTPTATPIGEDQPSADVETLKATLNGSSQVPTNSSFAAGTASLDYDLDTDLYSLTSTISGIPLANITGTRIQAGKAGVSGPVIVDLGTAWASESGKLVLNVTNQTFPATQSAALLAGDTYFNILTTTYPNGEIRGQLTSNYGMGGGDGSATPTPTPTPVSTVSASPISTGTPRPTSTPIVSSAPTTTASASAYQMPVTGATENTIALAIVGMILLGAGGYFIIKSE